MSQLKPWNRIACAITLATFATSALIPSAAHAQLIQQSTSQVVDEIKSGLRLALSSGEARDVVEFVQEDVSDADLASIVSILSNIDPKTLPTISVQGTTIRFGKPSEGNPELKVIDAETGRFRYGKKELLVRDGMSFDDFFFQFQAKLDADSSTLTSFLWSLFAEDARADEDVVVVEDGQQDSANPAATTAKPGMSTGKKIALLIIVALVAFFIFKAIKKKKEKKDEEAAQKKKAESDKAAQGVDRGAFETAKTSYDAARSEYEARCGQPAAGAQLRAIAPEDASLTQKTNAMTRATERLASDPCASSTASDAATTH